jgi:hypothetical protein
LFAKSLKSSDRKRPMLPNRKEEEKEERRRRGH